MKLCAARPRPVRPNRDDQNLSCCFDAANGAVVGPLGH